MIATGSNTADQQDNRYVFAVGAWSGAQMIDMGVSGSVRVTLTGRIYEGTGSVVLYAGDNPDYTANEVLASFTLPPGIDSSNAVDLYSETEPVGRYVTLVPSGTVFGPAHLWVYPV